MIVPRIAELDTLVEGHDVDTCPTGLDLFAGLNLEIRPYQERLVRKALDWFAGTAQQPGATDAQPAHSVPRAPGCPEPPGSSKVTVWSPRREFKHRMGL